HPRAAAGSPAPVQEGREEARRRPGSGRGAVSAGAGRATAYLWFPRPRGGPEVLAHRTHLLLPAGTVPDPVYWHGGGVDLSNMLPGQTGYLPYAEGDRLVTYDYGLADSRAASVTVAGDARSPFSPSNSLSGRDTPVPG